MLQCRKPLWLHLHRTAMAGFKDALYTPLAPDLVRLALGKTRLLGWGKLRLLPKRSSAALSRGNGMSAVPCLGHRLDPIPRMLCQIQLPQALLLSLVEMRCHTVALRLQTGSEWLPVVAA